MIVVLLFNPTHAVAETSVAAAQKKVDALRTLAAEKYEDANETNIRIAQLERETRSLKVRETQLQKKLDASGDVIARIAISNFMRNGFGDTFDLMFSADPSQYLSDASVMEVLSRGYGEKLREFATDKQQVQASRLVVTDRTKLLELQKIKLNKEVASARIALAKAEKILKSLKKEDREKLIKEEDAREAEILARSKKYAASYAGDNSRGSKALKFALKQVGDVYVWAAAGPTRWDCSGLTMRAFQTAGVSLPHSSRIQVKYGRAISYSNLKPGDLVFFGNPISHVSIYMGGGKMVQAPRPGKRVEVVAMTRKFGSKPFVAARRL